MDNPIHCFVILQNSASDLGGAIPCIIVLAILVLVLVLVNKEQSKASQARKEAWE
jgi:hypothetical protein